MAAGNQSACAQFHDAVLGGTYGTVVPTVQLLRYRTYRRYRRYSLDLRLLVIPLKVWGYPRNFGFTLRSLLMGRYDPATVTPALVEPEASESTARAARAPQAVQGFTGGACVAPAMHREIECVAPDFPGSVVY